MRHTELYVPETPEECITAAFFMWAQREGLTRKDLRERLVCGDARITRLQAGIIQSLNVMDVIRAGCDLQSLVTDAARLAAEHKIPWPPKG